MLKTKSIASPIEPAEDGLRLLVTRFRGRGLETSRYDVWMANLGPSEKLLREVQQGNITWAEFSRRYREELFHSQELDRGNDTIKNHGQKFTLRLIKHLAEKQVVTLLCHCAEDQKQCHRHVLQTVILSKAV